MQVLSVGRARCVKVFLRRLQNLFLFSHLPDKQNQTWTDWIIFRHRAEEEVGTGRETLEQAFSYKSRPSVEELLALLPGQHVADALVGI